LSAIHRDIGLSYNIQWIDQELISVSWGITMYANAGVTDTGAKVLAVRLLILSGCYCASREAYF